MGGGATRMQDSQHHDPSRDARQLPSGVTTGHGSGKSALSIEPCTNAEQREKPGRSAKRLRPLGAWWPYTGTRSFSPGTRPFTRVPQAACG
jgi:hypothetical protein